MGRPHRTLPLAIALALLAAPAARAEPKSIGLGPMVKGSDVIAVARFAGPGPLDPNAHRVELEFTRVLKGDLRPGKYTATFTDVPWVGTGAPEFVAFFRTGLRWRFAAWPVSGEPGVADRVLAVAGFYDRDAYLVSPGLVTLAQIEALVRGEPLAYTFRGPLSFPRRGRPGYEASGPEVEIRYDATSGRVEVTGLSELKGFTARPRVTVGRPFGRRGLTLSYSFASDAPLELGGEVLSWDPAAGVFRTEFFVREPVVLTKEELEAYGADPLRGRSYYRARIACAPAAAGGEARALTLTLGRDLGAGEGPLEGWGPAPLEVARIEYKGPQSQATFLHANVPPEVFEGLPEREWSLTVASPLGGGDYLVLRFEVGEPPGGVAAFRGRERATEGLLYALLAGDVPGAVYEHRGGRTRLAATFTASLEGVHYETLAEPRVAREEETRGWAEDDGEDRDEEAEDGGGWRGVVLPAAAVAVAVLAVAGVVFWWLRRRNRGLPTATEPAAMTD